MDEEYWKQRVAALEQRIFERSREWAKQHVALGKLMDVVEDAQHEYSDPQAQELIARFERILQDYARFRAQFHGAEWALRDRSPAAPAAGEGAP